MFAHYPRLAAWVVSLALIGVGTFGGVLGLQTMGPALPAHLEHIHGFIVAVESNGIFTVQAPGYSSPLWFRVAPGAPISLDHLRRHLREHAATDIFYQDRQGKMFLAWDAD